MGLRAVFWDLDGTLVDSEPHWFTAERTLASEFGVTWTFEDAVAMVGTPIMSTVGHLISAGVRLSPEETHAELMARMRELIRVEGIEFRPGARELSEALAERGVIQALVTMSYGPYMDAIMPWLPPLAHVQLGDSVEHGKPAPDIYIAAMQAVGVDPRDSLAIEDSPSGVGAILAAGVTPIAVPAHAPVPEHDRLIRLETLDGVTPDDLFSLHQRWQSGEI